MSIPELAFAVLDMACLNFLLHVDELNFVPDFGQALHDGFGGLLVVAVLALVDDGSFHDKHSPSGYFY